jgi:hypothetical protein
VRPCAPFTHHRSTRISLLSPRNSGSHLHLLADGPSSTIRATIGMCSGIARRMEGEAYRHMRFLRRASCRVSPPGLAGLARPALPLSLSEQRGGSGARRPAVEAVLGARSAPLPLIVVDKASAVCAVCRVVDVSIRSAPPLRPLLCRVNGGRQPRCTTSTGVARRRQSIHAASRCVRCRNS